MGGTILNTNSKYLGAVCLMAAALPVLGHDAANGNQAGPSKLVFLIPNLYGSAGLVLPNTAHAAHFNGAFQSSFGPLVGSIVNQLTVLPIPSPASGFLYQFDRALGGYSRSGQSFGPIFAERAETIGKNKFLAGVSYQHFNFDHLDGIDIKHIPSVFQHQPAENPDYQKDLITTDNSVDIQVGQTVAYFTYGLTERLDVSVAVPMASAHLEAASDATIRRIGTSNDPTIHYFDTPGGDRKVFNAAGSAQGIGDVLLRAKVTAVRWKHGAAAGGLDLRLPTGDEYNFLGAGSTGVRPFMAVSFRAKSFSPHLNLSYLWNGNSVLAGDPVMGIRGKQSNQVQYAAGFDIGVSPKFTVAMDYLGRQQLKGERITQTQFRAANGALFPNVAVANARISQNSGSFGFKVNPVADLLLTFNLLVALDNHGLRDRVAPMIGVSYTF